MQNDAVDTVLLVIFLF